LLGDWFWNARDAISFTVSVGFRSGNGSGFRPSPLTVAKKRRHCRKAAALAKRQAETESLCALRASAL
jgi:hypothetical protein